MLRPGPERGPDGAEPAAGRHGGATRGIHPALKFIPYSGVGIRERTRYMTTPPLEGPMRFLVPLCLLLAIAACHSKEVKRYEEYPPRPGDAYVEVWMGTSAPADLANAVPDHKLGRPPRGIKIIGEIRVSKSATWGWAEMMRDAKREAAKMGGDGLILEHDRGSLVSSATITMLVFRFPEEGEKKE
jgi:hypothetical protein